MKIKTNVLYDFIPTEDRHGIAFATIAGTVRNIYCGRMTVRALCTENCEDCKLRIVNSLQWKGTLTGPPIGLLVWKLKQAVAIAEEEELKNKAAVAVKRDQFGSKAPVSEVNPFLNFLKEELK